MSGRVDVRLCRVRPRLKPFTLGAIATLDTMVSPS